MTSETLSPRTDVQYWISAADGAALAADEPFAAENVEAGAGAEGAEVLGPSCGLAFDVLLADDPCAPLDADTWLAGLGASAVEEPNENGAALAFRADFSVDDEDEAVALEV